MKKNEAQRNNIMSLHKYGIDRIEISTTFMRQIVKNNNPVIYNDFGVLVWFVDTRDLSDFWL